VTHPHKNHNIQSGQYTNTEQTNLGKHTQLHTNLEHTRDKDTTFRKQVLFPYSGENMQGEPTEI